jgi:hypothetical protein
MKPLSLLVLSAIIYVFPVSAQLEKDTVLLFFLGGQSNMDGYGYNKDLPAKYQQAQCNVKIFHGNPAPDGAENGGIGIWDILKPGHGVGFSSDGKTNSLSERFGPELSFAYRLHELLPNQKIAIIKYSRGGTSLDSLAAGEYGSWDPDFRSKSGINQYDHFLTTMRSAFNSVSKIANGKEVIFKPSGILWMQGESDALYSREIAMNYQHNLKRMMDLIKAAMLSDNIPVVIGKISDSGRNKQGKIWKYGELVQFAQEEYVNSHPNTAIIRATSGYRYSDPYHYNSEAYLDLGIRFAEVIANMLRK